MNADTLLAEINRSPFNAWLRLAVEALDASAGRLSLRMAARPELMRLPGDAVFHGGPLAALADIAGDYAVMLKLGGGVPTVQLGVDYMKPCAGTHAIAHAQLRRMGRTLGWVDVEIHDARGSLCVLARGHYLAQVG
jgi:uncharacterized protein (TIGR00369 family)